ncbi:MAG: T9SS type A sorting domain-containing protein, partial [Flavobacteriales bacterium]|nr:T9SS type A sorting domain-containing protein [Flavobacteriales bacterium]
NTLRDTITVSSCDMYAWISNGQSYTMTGVYSDTNMAVSGCDSISVLDLTINNTLRDTITVSSCDMYAWISNGQSYTMTGMYSDTNMAVSGCDSISVLDLSINSTLRDTITVSSCDMYAWISNGQSYTMTGVYSDTNMTGSGCDSISVLDLTITSVNSAVTRTGFDLIADQAGATYQWLDCNNGNAPIAGEIFQTFSVGQNGSYAVEVTLNNCTDTSSCFSVINVGVDEIRAENRLLVYPNPADERITIETNKESIGSMVQIFGVNGKLIFEGKLQSTKQQIDVFNLADGIYFIKIGTSIKKLVISK